MAENESLDLGKSRRWYRVLVALREGKPVDQLAVLAASCLRQTVKGVRKPIIEGGPPQLPLAQLLDASEKGREEVERIVRRCRGHDYAYLFRDATAGIQSRQDCIERFLCAIYEKFSDQIVIKAVKADGQHTLSWARSQLDQVQTELQPEVKRVARQLAVNPNHRLQRPRSGGSDQTLLNTRAVLKESLLGKQ